MNQNFGSLVRFFIAMLVIQLLLLAPLARAQALRSLGLFPSQSSYSSHEYKNLNLVPFSTSRPGQMAPLAFRIQLNQNPLSDATEILSEQMFAHVPVGKTIQVLSSTEWNFPVGTRVVHELRFKDKLNTLFEIRMIEKLDDKNWGYGTYVPDGKDLRLISISESEQKSFSLETESGIQWQVQLYRVPQKACARCHTGRSLNEKPIDAFEQTGPCEFQPRNPVLLNTWAQSFQSKNGWNPFSK